MLAAVSRAVLDPPVADAKTLRTSLPDLEHRYRGLCHAPAPAPSALLGRARNYNVLYFVLETAPAQVFDPVRIDWPTSHIDVSPTVLDLVGVEQNRAWGQGADIWNRGLQKRRLFLTMDLFGSSVGFSESGSYYLRSGTQTVFKNTAVHFEANDALLGENAGVAARPQRAGGRRWIAAGTPLSSAER